MNWRKNPKPLEQNPEFEKSEPKAEVPAPQGVGKYNERNAYLTLEQAAYIMQQTPEQLLEYINSGLMLCYKPSLDGPGPVMIHQSELDRFKHPWKHIWRIDDRINALQGRLEACIKKVDGDSDTQSQVNSLSMSVDSLEEAMDSVTGADGIKSEVDALKCYFADIEAQWNADRTAVKRSEKTISQLSNRLDLLCKLLGFRKEQHERFRKRGRKISR